VEQVKTLFNTYGKLYNKFKFFPKKVYFGNVALFYQDYEINDGWKCSTDRKNSMDDLVKKQKEGNPF
jgi:hypothetical protein